LKGCKGFTLLEVLVASVLASGALATLGMWCYKQPWNQMARHKVEAQAILATGMEHRLHAFPDSLHEEIDPLENGKLATWRWTELPNGGWCLKGEVLDARGKSLGMLVGARWR